MSTSLKIFGETYNNVAGIKAKDLNDDTLTYVLASDTTPTISGNAITVEDTVDPLGGTVRSIEAVDISDSTITASTIKTGYVGYTANGIRVLGSMTDAVSGLPIYTSGNGLDYTPTMIITGDGSDIGTILSSYGTMPNLVDLTITGLIGRITSGTIGQNETFGSSLFPNLKRLTIAPTAIKVTNSDPVMNFSVGHYFLNGTNLRELTLGALNGTYFTGGGYFRSDMPVPPGTGTGNIGSLDGLRLVIYTDQYRVKGGFLDAAYTSLAPTTILTQYDYQTGEELTA